jgi:hypothetical protein
MIDPATIDLSALPWLPLDAKAAFPRQPCIYFAIDSQGAVQYIGRTIDPGRRWRNHHKYSELSILDGVRILYLFMDADLLLSAERALIKWFAPPLNGRIPFVVTRTGPRAMLAPAFKPLAEKLLAAGEVVPEGEVERQVKALALNLAGEIRRHWRLTITETQSAVEVCNKIAAKLGLEAGGETNRLRLISTPTGRQWTYRIKASDDWLSP